MAGIGGSWVICPAVSFVTSFVFTWLLQAIMSGSKITSERTLIRVILGESYSGFLQKLFIWFSSGQYRKFFAFLQVSTGTG